jgi:hypothetical protein
MSLPSQRRGARTAHNLAIEKPAAEATRDVARRRVSALIGGHSAAKDVDRGFLLFSLVVSGQIPSILLRRDRVIE